MKNRNGLIVKAACLATGTAERDVAAERLAKLPGSHRKTVGADKNYDTQGFVAACRKMKVTSHVARNENRHGALRSMDVPAAMQVTPSACVSENE